MTDPWHLIATGRYEEAVVAYSIVARQPGQTHQLRNRSLAYLMLGRLAAARADILAAKAENPSARRRGHVHSVGDDQWLGLFEWLEGHFESASQIWLAAAKLTTAGRVVYTDASGGTKTGSLLAFAAVRLSDPSLFREAETLFSYIVAKGRPDSWPGPIARFYLSITPAEVLLSSVSSVPVLRERELCQAHFAIGVMALRARNAPLYYSSLSQAAGLTPALIENEFHLARYEVAVRGA
jgi:hypothetical protein